VAPGKITQRLDKGIRKKTN